MGSIIRVLMERDGLDKDEAVERVEEFIRFAKGIDPWEIEEEFQFEFGLEPDYLFNLMCSKLWNQIYAAAA